MAINFPDAPTLGQVFQNYVWDSEKWLGTSTVAGAALVRPLRGWIAGLTLSTTGSSPTFGIAAGEATNSTVSDLLQLASAYTKTTAAWAVGTGVGALDTGAIAASSWYHVFLIKRPDTGVVDVLVSLSATAPTLPTNYTLFRRIGSMLTAASQWVKFSQSGDDFLWDVPVRDVNAGSFTGGTASLITLSVPLNMKTTATVTIEAGVGVVVYFYISSLDQTDTAAGITCFTMIGSASFSNPVFNGGIRTDTASRIRVRTDVTANNVFVFTRGWIDRRGRDD